MTEFYLRKNEEVYGPAEIDLLQGWAADGRIGPEDALASSPTGPWLPAWEVDELDMNWEVLLSDGSTYGPVHILALRHSLLDESIDPDSHVRDRDVGQSYPVSLALCIGLMEQNRLLEEEVERLQAELDTLSGEASLSEIESEVATLTATNRRYREEVETLRMQLATGQGAATDARKSDPSHSEDPTELLRHAEEARKQAEIRADEAVSFQDALQMELEQLQADYDRLRLESPPPPPKSAE